MAISTLHVVRFLRTPVRNWRLVLIGYVTVTSLLGVFEHAPANTKPIWTGATLAIGLLSMVVLWRIGRRWRLNPLTECTRCGRISPGNAAACRWCGADFPDHWGTQKAPRWEAIPVCRHRHGNLIALQLGCYIVWIVVAIRFLPDQWIGSAPVGLFVLASILTMGLWLKVRRLGGIVAELQARAGAVCIECAYPKEDGIATCPECGKTLSLEETRRRWQSAGIWFPDAEGVCKAEAVCKPK